MTTDAGSPEFAPPVALSSGPLGAVQAADREIARQTAVRARAVVEFAASRPSSVDRPQGTKGAMSPERWAARPELLRPVSEWAAQELSVALSITTDAAETLMHRSLALVRRLPGTLAALQAGALHPGHLWPLLDKVAPIADDAIRREVETELLGWAAGRVTTPAQLAAKARRVVLKRDARAAARAAARAVAERGVFWRPEHADGMGAVTAALLLPESRALYEALGAYADALADEPGAPPRTRAQKMADCLLDLVLRPGECDLPPVQVALTLVASVATVLGGDHPAEVDGHPVPAELARQLLRGLTGADLSHPGVHALDADPEFPPPDPDEYAWDSLVQDELARWGEDMERRILAGEFDDPAPCPDEAPRPDDLRQRDPVPGPAAAAATASGPLVRADAEAEPESEPEADAETHADGEDERVGMAESDIWWSLADEAVNAASRALMDTHGAIARAARMVRTAAASDAGDEAAWAAGPGGRLTAAEDTMTALIAASRDQRARLGDLLRRTGGGGLAERPRIAVTDALTGGLLALTDLTGLRRAAHCGRPGCARRPERCDHDLTGRPGLGPPEATDGYRPGAELDRFLRARDRRCRFPGCRRRVPRGGELDHDTRYPDGPTSAANMAGYCTANHRGKHQAPGWRHHLQPNGRLIVTTPTGLEASTDPPPY